MRRRTTATTISPYAAWLAALAQSHGRWHPPAPTSTTTTNETGARA